MKTPKHYKLQGSGGMLPQKKKFKLGPLRLLLRLCLGQNDTKIFTPVSPVLPVVTTASEVT